MQQHHQRRGPRPARLDPRSVELAVVHRGLTPARRCAGLEGGVVGPQQAGGDAAPGTPALGELQHRLRVRALGELQGVLGGDLQGEVARRPAVGAAQAEQDVDVGGPRPIPSPRSARRGPPRRCLRRGGSGPGRRGRPRRSRAACGSCRRDSPAPTRCVSFRASRTAARTACRPRRAVPDRRRARHRDLLADNDAGQPLEAGGRRRSGGSPARSCTRRMMAHLRRSARTPSRRSAVGRDDPRQRPGGSRFRVRHGAFSGDPTAALAVKMKGRNRATGSSSWCQASAAMPLLAILCEPSRGRRRCTRRRHLPQRAARLLAELSGRHLRAAAARRRPTTGAYSSRATAMRACWPARCPTPTA